ncbi:unnamed protein product [Trichogramma brassicae]|uniref:DUF3456 domain-containing protein n=1 Tax=Trichogramma brassicae TaxID=86971 RepID=A0A6H5ILT5_9HYME|nr:unnamed protein product [Trichogramma brassicae]
MIVDNGADIEARNGHGDTALQLAVSRLDTELTRALLKYGASLRSLNANRMFNLDFTSRELKFCRSIVDEFQNEVNKIDPTKEIAIGQYKLDAKGNSHQKKVPLAKSEVHLSDMLDSICKKMQDYVRAKYKSNGKLTLLKLIENGQMNPLMNEVDIIQDGDLNKSLEYFCEEVVNDYEDSFIQVMTQGQRNPKLKICLEESNYCKGFMDEHDDESEDESSESTEKTEL